MSAPIYKPICFYCRHYNANSLPAACAAFPGGIPEPIFDSESDHRLPFEGDHGVRFEGFGAAPLPLELDPFAEPIEQPGPEDEHALDAVWQREQHDFDPNQARDEEGRWTDDGGAGGPSGEPAASVAPTPEDTKKALLTPKKGVSVWSDSRADVRQVSEEILGEALDPEQVAALVGAPEGASVEIKASSSEGDDGARERWWNSSAYSNWRDEQQRDYLANVSDRDIWDEATGAQQSDLRTAFMEDFTPEPDDDYPQPTEIFLDNSTVEEQGKMVREVSTDAAGAADLKRWDDAVQAEKLADGAVERTEAAANAIEKKWHENGSATEEYGAAKSAESRALNERRGARDTRAETFRSLVEVDELDLSTDQQEFLNEARTEWSDKKLGDVEPSEIVEWAGGQGGRSEARQTYDDIRDRMLENYEEDSYSESQAFGEWRVREGEDKTVLKIEVTGGGVKKMERTIMKDDNGDAFIYNDYFQVERGTRGRGIGSAALWDEVRAAQALGIKKIRTSAAGDGASLETNPGSFNGFYTWPRLGYDGQINPDGLPSELRGKMPKDSRSILDLFSIPGGAEWWKKNGHSFSATFDTRPDSRSYRILSEYMRAAKARQAAKSAPVAAAPSPKSMPYMPSKAAPKTAPWAKPWQASAGGPRGYDPENPPLRGPDGYLPPELRKHEDPEPLTDEDEEILNRIWLKERRRAARGRHGLVPAETLYDPNQARDEGGQWTDDGGGDGGDEDGEGSALPWPSRTYSDKEFEAKNAAYLAARADLAAKAKTEGIGIRAEDRLDAEQGVEFFYDKMSRDPQFFEQTMDSLRGAWVHIGGEGPSTFRLAAQMAFGLEDGAIFDAKVGRFREAGELEQGTATVWAAAMRKEYEDTQAELAKGIEFETMPTRVDWSESSDYSDWQNEQEKEAWDNASDQDKIDALGSKGKAAGAAWAAENIDEVSKYSDQEDGVVAPDATDAWLEYETRTPDEMREKIAERGADPAAFDAAVENQTATHDAWWAADEKKRDFNKELAKKYGDGYIDIDKMTDGERGLSRTLDGEQSRAYNRWTKAKGEVEAAFRDSAKLTEKDLSADEQEKFTNVRNDYMDEWGPRAYVHSDEGEERARDRFIYDLDLDDSNAYADWAASNRGKATAPSLTIDPEDWPYTLTRGVRRGAKGYVRNFAESFTTDKSIAKQFGMELIEERVDRRRVLAFQGGKHWKAKKGGFGWTENEWIVLSGRPRWTDPRQQKLLFRRRPHEDAQGQEGGRRLDYGVHPGNSGRPAQAGEADPGRPGGSRRETYATPGQRQGKTLYELLHELAGKSENQLAEAFLVALAAVQESVSLSELEAALKELSDATRKVPKDADAEKVLKAINWHTLGSPALRAGIDAIVTDVVGKAGDLTAGEIRELPGIEGVLDHSFNMKDPRVQKWIRAHGADLVKDITATQKDAIRDILARAWDEGLHPYDQAKLIRDHIGLLPWQEDAVARLDRSLRDESEDETEIRRQTGKATGQYLDQRAEVIARHETIVAAYQGHREGWRQAAEEELIDTDVAVQQWTAATESPRTCAFCAWLDGKTAKLDEPFPDPPVELEPSGYVPGSVFQPGDPHVQCRCGIMMRPYGLSGEPPEQDGRTPAEQLGDKLSGKKARHAFDPNQERDDSGRWTDGGGSDERANSEKRLASSPVKERRDLGGGVSETEIVTLGDGTRAVFKPAEGEPENELRDDIEPGQQTEREVAAWEVAKIVGMDDLVAPTIEREIDGKRGALIAWQEGDLAFNLNTEDSFDGSEDLARAAIFDFVIGNSDRHARNWLVEKKTEKLDMRAIAEESGGKLLDGGRDSLYVEFDSAAKGRAFADKLKSLGIEDVDLQDDEADSGKAWVGATLTPERIVGRKLRLIDHGLAFPSSESIPQGNTAFMAHAGNNLSAIPADVVSKYVRAVPQLEKRLRELGLPDRAIGSVKRRIELLNEADSFYGLGRYVKQSMWWVGTE
jgi:hypothetical protein